MCCQKMSVNVKCSIFFPKNFVKLIHSWLRSESKVNQVKIYYITCLSCTKRYTTVLRKTIGNGSLPPKNVCDEF